MMPRMSQDDHIKILAKAISHLVEPKHGIVVKHKGGDWFVGINSEKKMFVLDGKHLVLSEGKSLKHGAYMEIEL